MADSNREIIRKLTQLEGKLLKAFIRESDPDNWIGRGYDPKDLGEKQKSLRLMDKRNAQATYSVLKVVKDKREEMTRPLQKAGAQPVTTEADLIDDLNQQAELQFKHLQSLN